MTNLNSRSFFFAVIFLFINTLFAADLSIGDRCLAINDWMKTNSDSISVDDSRYQYLTPPPTVALFRWFPQLVGQIPYVDIAHVPTPVYKMENLGEELEHGNLYIKNDSQTNFTFGGNKPRKLAFLLGWAVKHKVDQILTCGGAGSNHSTATITLSSLPCVNIPCKSFLSDQQPTFYAGRNLLLSHYYGGKLSLYPDYTARQEALLETARELQAAGKRVFYIPGGGSTARGSLGFVNAALELADQIRAGKLPEPDQLFVAAGSNGTAAGLALGIAIAGLKTEIVAVDTCAQTAEAFAENCKTLITDMTKLLGITSRDIKGTPAKPGILMLPTYRTEYLGEGYAHIPQKTAEALATIQQTSGLTLDGTYSGKALAAFFDTAALPQNKDKVLLFWNTFFAEDQSHIIFNFDAEKKEYSANYSDVPEAFHRYFTSGLQESDSALNTGPDYAALFEQLTLKDPYAEYEA